MRRLAGWLRQQWSGLTQSGRDRGAAITGVVVVLTAAGFLMLGLVVDGGTYVRSMTRAERVASEAARAGLAYYRASGVPDPDGAAAAARRYVEAADTNGALTGTVTVGADRLEVQVTVQAPTTFLQLIGQDELVGAGDGAADLVNTVNGN